MTEPASKPKETVVHKRAAQEEEEEVDHKRARVDPTALHLIGGVTDVPKHVDLLDQVISAAGGCTGIGARVEFAWGPEPGGVREEVARVAIARMEDLVVQDLVDQRRREAGETVARRSKFFDDVTPDPTPDVVYTVVRQRWEPAPPAAAAAAAPVAQSAVEIPDLRIFLTHHVIRSVSVIFEARPAMSERAPDTGAFSHILRIRIEADGPNSVLEVRYLLHEDLLHSIQTGPMSEFEDASLRDILKGNTWIDDIPFVLSTRAAEYESFCKRMDVHIPGDCDAAISHDLLTLKRTLRIHDHPNAAKYSAWGNCQPEVYATDAFYDALTTGHATDSESRVYTLRWLQLTPIGPPEYRADNGGKKMDVFYESE